MTIARPDPSASRNQWIIYADKLAGKRAELEDALRKLLSCSEPTAGLPNKGPCDHCVRTAREALGG